MRQDLAGTIVAGQGAVSVVDARGGVLHDTIKRLDVEGVEINQVRLIGGMRVVAGRAGGMKFLDVLFVIRPTGGQFAVHHRTAVALIAQSEAGGIVAGPIGQLEIAFQQRREG